MLPGYSHFYLNQRDRRGGGVSLQINLPGFQLLNDFTTITLDYEILCIRNGKNMFGVVYRPPNGSIAAILIFLSNLFLHANENGYTLTLGGDFNIDILSDSGPAIDLLPILQCHDFRNEIASPTRITTLCTSLLDIFITNSHAEKIISKALSSDLSDHLPIVLMMEETAANRETRSYRNRVSQYFNIHVTKFPRERQAC